MGECSKCGDKAMTFTCRYCGDKFCSEHRLPENHDCKGLEEGVEEEKEEKKKWFEEKESKEKQEERTVTASRRRSKPGILQTVWNTLKSNITYTIIAVTVLSFLLQQVPGFTELFLLSAEAEAVLYRPWTLLTTMLLHGGLLHLAANMITFYFFGTPVEKVAGRHEVLKLYLGAGAASSLAHVAFRNLLRFIHGAEMPVINFLGMQMGGVPTMLPAVGASGAVFAFVGAVAMLYPRTEVLLYFIIPMRIKSAVQAFAGFAAINLLLKLAGIQLPVIGMFASSAHLAGLAVGLWYGKKLREKYRQQTGLFNPFN
ncbi:MAG: rhomboid family intramembrane serine protease [Candidatus Nanohalobium sp.]